MSDSTRIQKFAASASPLISRLAIAKLSEDIIMSVANRRAFVANPSLFVKEKYGFELDDADNSYVDRLREMVADGFCCKGCACALPDFGEQVINPALRG